MRNMQNKYKKYKTNTATKQTQLQHAYKPTIKQIQNIQIQSNYKNKYKTITTQII